MHAMWSEHKYVRNGREQLNDEKDKERKERTLNRETIPWMLLTERHAKRSVHQMKMVHWSIEFSFATYTTPNCTVCRAQRDGPIHETIQEHLREMLMQMNDENDTKRLKVCWVYPLSLCVRCMHCLLLFASLSRYLDSHAAKQLYARFVLFVRHTTSTHLRSAIRAIISQLISVGCRWW